MPNSRLLAHLPLRLYFLICLILVLSLGLLVSCKSQKLQEAKIGKITRLNLTSFTFAEIDQIEIIKNNPLESDSWSARLKRDPERRLRWKIESSSTQILETRDTLGNATLIDHILDTLTNGKIHEVAEDTSLESVGLKPAFFAIRIFSGDKVEELSIGEELPQKDSRWVAISPEGPPLLAKGAFVRMLGILKGERDLHEPKIFTLNPSQIQKLTIERPGNPKLIAERRSGGWTNAQNKELPATMNALLEHLAHFRIDDVVPLQGFGSKIPNNKLKPLVTVTVEGYKLPAEHVRLYVKTGSAGSQSHLLAAEIFARDRKIFDVSEDMLLTLNEISKALK